MLENLILLKIALICIHFIVNSNTCFIIIEHALVFFSGDPTSRTFDITLMILLIKNLTPIKISDVLPYPTHTNLGAHLSRIKFYRNMISHSEHGTIGKTYFAECWENIAMVRVISFTLKYLSLQKMMLV